MKQHFVTQAIMAMYPKDCLCPIGAVCEKNELDTVLKGQGVKGYKLKSVDGEAIADWEKKDWVMI